MKEKKFTIFLTVALLGLSAYGAMKRGPNGYRAAEYPTVLNGTLNPTAEQLAAAGYREETAAELAEWEAGQDDAVAELAAAELAANVAAIGPRVTVLAFRLNSLGYTNTPWVSADIYADLMGRSYAGTLTDSEMTTFGLLTDQYQMLKMEGYTDIQINAVWEAMQ